MRKQGKIKSIPVTEVIEGMQVYHNIHGIGKVLRIDEDRFTVRLGVFDLTHRNFSISELKTLVFEYPSNQEEILRGEIPKDFKQIPLKYSQWQSALDNNEVDSDKVVEFEIKDILINISPKNSPLHKTVFNKTQIAKVIPTKKKTYTEDELILLLSKIHVTSFEEFRNMMGGTIIFPDSYKEYIKQNLK